MTFLNKNKRIRNRNRNRERERENIRITLSVNNIPIIPHILISMDKKNFKHTSYLL